MAPRGEREPGLRPSISVVIAAYNAAPYLGQALDSVLRQADAPPTEVIVIDDGSTDETPEILARYGDAVRTERQTNAGPARARNHGARIARGQWLAFLDADDLWARRKLARQMRRAESDRTIALIYTDQMSFGNGSPRRLSARMTLPEGEIFQELFRRNFITLSSAMMRRSAFQEAGGFCEELMGTEDWDLWLRHAALHPVGVCRAPLTFYRRHPEGISQHPDHMVAAHLKAVYRTLALPRCHDWSAPRIRAVLSRSWQTSAAFAERTQPRWALHCYMRSLLYGSASSAALRGLARCLVSGWRREHAPAAARSTATGAPGVSARGSPRRSRWATPIAGTGSG
jgi:glycosyltransferase involved in cell wall biosynthesis